jgi:hypothetical protein
MSNMKNKKIEKHYKRLEIQTNINCEYKEFLL